MRDIQVYPLFFSGEPASALKERWQWTFPIVFYPLDSNMLFTSSQHLWKTTNNGQSWDDASARISPGPIRRHSAIQAGRSHATMNGPEIFATIFTLGAVE